MIAAFMVANNFTNISEVQQYYTLRHLEMVKGLGARSIVWNDPLEHNVTVWLTDSESWTQSGGLPDG